MSRLGKIARLPRAVRDTLNVRLHEDSPGPELLAWLNAEPSVQAVLTAHFDGSPINAQNLSDWRQGGHAEWCREQRILELAACLHEAKADLDEAIDADVLADHLTRSSMLVLTRELNATWGMEEGPERRRAVLAVIGTLLRLRREPRAVDRGQREPAGESRPVRAAEPSEEVPPPAAPARRTPPPPGPEPVTADDDPKVSAIWSAALKLATGTPHQPVSVVGRYGPKLPALQAA
ncbi:MAG: hypothetical protein NTV51_31460 [Verrucomicrobia bacterium]|nr:hypothetical protein [Verrucomicrobiota bacterium]